MLSVYVQRQRIIRTWLLLLVKLNTRNNTSGRMITLSKKLRQEKASEGSSVLHNASSKRISVRDKLLAKEVQELNQALPTTCRVRFDNPDILHEFQVTITPDESFWKGGKFVFQVSVTEEYNIAPPIARCLTKLWHPNITEDGEICLSILRQNSIDGMGWAPTRRLKDVVWGINSLFTDLLNFDDPLNIEAAEQFRKDRDAFEAKVKDYVNKYAKR